MRKIYILWVFLLCLSAISAYDTIKIVNFKSYPHEKKCYTQGLFFLNSTHAFESCGLYNKSYFRVLKYDFNDTGFKL